MPYPLRLIEFGVLPQEPGDCWYLDGWVETAPDGSPIFNHSLSRHYREHVWPKRRPIAIRLPNGGMWVPDMGSENGDGWQVTGDPPNLTARPSILARMGGDGSRDFHGWLTDGVLSEDIDGHTY